MNIILLCTHFQNWKKITNGANKSRSLYNVYMYKHENVI